MKGFNFFDRQSRKTLEGLVASHLSSEYHLAPRAAQTLCEDALVFGRLWGSQTRAAGQVLFHAVAIEEPAGKPLRDCRMVEVRLTLRADADLELRRRQGLAALNRTLVARLCREAAEQQAVLSIEDLADFLRISLLARDGYSPGETARLAKLSKGKVQAHRRLLAELEVDPFYEGALRRVLDIYRLQRAMKKGGAHR